MKYKHVIWDWNGTLFNDVELCVDIINGMLGKRNLRKLTVSEYKTVFTFPVKDYYAELFDFERESFEVLGREWMEEYEKRKMNCSLACGTKEIVAEIHRVGIVQHILSAYSLNTLVDLVKHFDLLKYMNSVKGLDNIYAHSKKELGIELIEEIGGDNREIVLIGDTLHDAEVAKEMNIDSILIPKGHQAFEKLNDGKNIVVHSIEELKNVLL